MNRLVELLNNFNIKVEVKIFSEKDKMQDYVRIAYTEGKRNFLVSGGDGAIFYFINALSQNYNLNDPICLGIIPAGTGNALYSSIVGYQENLDLRLKTALSKIVMGNTNKLDIIELKDTEDKVYYCANVLSFGYGTESVKIRNKYLNKLGKIGYDISFFSELLTNIKNIHYELQIDGNLIDIDGLLFTVMNTRYTGNKIDYSPFSKTDDGYGELIVNTYEGRLSVLKYFFKARYGKHLLMDNLFYSSFQEIKFLNMDSSMSCLIDGEVKELIPKTIKMLPGFLKILC